MKWLLRVLGDCRDLWRLIRGTSDEIVRPFEPSHAAQYQDIDWFLWECEQYRKAPVFWFDHWRYHETPFAYPDPEPEQLRQAFNASKDDAFRKHGRHWINRMSQWADENFVREYDPFSDYARSPDPVGYAWREFQKHVTTQQKT